MTRIVFLKEHEARMVAEGSMDIGHACLIVDMRAFWPTMEQATATIRSKKRRAAAPLRWWARRARLALRWLLLGRVGVQA